MKRVRSRLFYLGCYHSPSNIYLEVVTRKNSTYSCCGCAVADALFNLGVSVKIQPSGRQNIVVNARLTGNQSIVNDVLFYNSYCSRYLL